MKMTNSEMLKAFKVKSDEYEHMLSLDYAYDEGVDEYTEQLRNEYIELKKLCSL